jgi:hypothetical protein
LEAVAVSKKEVADKAWTEAEEAAQAITSIEEMKAREAAATAQIVILDD